jgi:alkanesulfonate monooxygenase SsuD/methylene tetrahydromethanopterin reductase-like flavin-dependent oxidoreductase (luciferase family)
VGPPHADVWNIPGGDLDDCTERNTRLDQFCTDIGRDPATITRSIVLPFTADRPHAARDTIRAVRDTGFTRIMLGLGSPYPNSIVEEVVKTINDAG